MKLFIKDNLGFILVYLFSFVLIFGCDLIFDGLNTVNNKMYFLF
ncbi:hypothetical protein [Clostridium senegalense]|nr:hypothetical protein [Clostridium senegalense]